jgi:cytochrome c oxidase subunit 2
MAMYVIAQPPAQFRTWLAHEARPASPQQGSPSPGFLAFSAENACSGCHTVRGTKAHGDVGPDLTHVASRLTLAAGTIPNRPADLFEWIRDPQHVKPGAKMPNLDLTDTQFRQIATYVESLK